MSVTLIAAVVALVLGHLAPSLAAAVRQYGWFGDWLRWLDARFGDGSVWHGRWGIALALVPPLLVIAVFQLALDQSLLGLASLLLGIVVLFYTWGPRDLDRDVEAIELARNPASRTEAAARLMPEGAVSTAGGALVDAVFRGALRRWFGVLFWFLLLGPFGALAYRLAALAAHGEQAQQLPPQTLRGARTLLALLEWPVAQLMTLALALVGNFDAVLTAWREHGGASLDLRNRFLAAAGRASVRSELDEDANWQPVGEADDTDDDAAVASRPKLNDLPELHDAMSLVWRVLLVWLAVLALFVIAGFVS